MQRLPIANREDELALFDTMVAGTSRERILLLEARGKLGKTTLMKEFVRRSPDEVPCVPVDLKGDPSMDKILAGLCDGLGWERLGAFAARVEELGQIDGGQLADAAHFEHIHREEYPLAAIRDLMLDAFTIDDLHEFCFIRPTLNPVLKKFAKDASKQKLVMIVLEFCQQRIQLPYLLAEMRKHNFEQYKRYYGRIYSVEAAAPASRETARTPGAGLGRAQIRDALRTAGEEDRITRLEVLTWALFEDLGAKTDRIVMLFDTFEHCSPEVGNWLAGSFLAHAQRVANLVVVIAGREVPEESIEWASCCHRRSLVNLDDVQAWDTYARGNGWDMPRAWIEAYCAATHGDPGQMDMLMVRAAQSGGGGR